MILAAVPIRTETNEGTSFAACHWHRRRLFRKCRIEIGASDSVVDVRPGPRLLFDGNFGIYR